MALFSSLLHRSVSRRQLLKAGFYGAAGLALYAGEVERHWVEVTHQPIVLAGLPSSFEGMRIAQLSDIHLDEYTEPMFLRHVIDRVNQMQPDMVVLTGDFVSDGLGATHYEIGAAWQCANLLTGLKCQQRFAVLGNHDIGVSAKQVSAALGDNGIHLLRNGHVAIERTGGRIWLAGLDDPVLGTPKPEVAIPSSIRNVRNEPVLLLCHAPDYADILLNHEAGSAVGLMLSGHTHGGQVRLPFLGAVELPELGQKYIEGLFHFGTMQLYVNRGIGTVGVPFRFNCPPEITLFSLHAA